MRRIALLAAWTALLTLIAAPAASAYCEDGGGASVRATTGDAGNVRDTSATLLGVVDGCMEEEVTYRFEYGPTAAYGQTTPLRTLDEVDGPLVAAGDVAGLQPGTTYHYRLIVNAPDEILVAGSDRTFTTTVGRPDAGPPGPAGPQGPPGPAGAGAFTPPVAGLQAPTGKLIDGPIADVYALMTYDGVTFTLNTVRFRVDQEITRVREATKEGLLTQTRLLGRGRRTSLEVTRPYDQDSVKLLRRLQETRPSPPGPVVLTYFDLSARPLLRIELERGVLRSQRVAIDAPTGEAEERIAFAFERASVQARPSSARRARLSKRRRAGVSGLRRATRKVLGRAAAARALDSEPLDPRLIVLFRNGVQVPVLAKSLEWSVERELVEVQQSPTGREPRIVLRPGELDVHATVTAAVTGDGGQPLLEAFDDQDERRGTTSFALSDAKMDRLVELSLPDALLERYDLDDESGALAETARLRATELVAQAP